jgi:methyl-accepting chemotaxis protein
MNVMQDKLANVVSTIRSGAESVATASSQIAQGNLDLSQRTEEQASIIQSWRQALQKTGSYRDDLSYQTRAGLCRGK